ncbi:eCIS core domain-containing protein [Nostoc sp. CMAA1605]|uniref:eCIS core domain-containing protein n=1 Tax=Nostoc sp. CMAA1605 TaxID=2055159 RepID=UPI001F22CF79|nr:DUF4157 domain-containing protein [Nostoc sp. CMAA1605]MCF4968337.1 hypothetical protein [Nostoc sp. CMAA1605]
MCSRQYKARKTFSKSSDTPASNPLELRPFVVQPRPQTPELQAQEEKLAHSDSLLRNISTFRPGYEPPPPPRIQTQLTIGEPGDKYEQEADRVAADVVQRINAPQMSPVQRSQVIEDENELQAKPLVQRMSNVGSMAAPPDLEASIQGLRGSGQPLTDSIREPMEQAFGANFSGVKVHTDSQSDQLNQLIQAKAFTTGQDIFFRQGAYNPSSNGGQELIAHELTHVVQQNGGAVQRSPQPSEQNASMSFTANPEHSIQRHPVHWERSQDVQNFLGVNPGWAFFGKTKLGRCQKAIREYQSLPEDGFAARKQKLTAIEKELVAWQAKYGVTKKDSEAARLIPVIQKMVNYEREEIDLSEQRASGKIDPDKPSSWRQARDFPTNAEYEITFRALMKLNLGKTGIDVPRLGEMDAQDKKSFQQATPDAVCNYANTGANISASRSFQFTNQIAAKSSSKGKSNLIVVQVIRPGYGIDVEQNAYNEEERLGIDSGITEKDKRKAREAKEIATLKNPPELILGWVEFPTNVINEAGSVEEAVRNNLIKFVFNPAYGKGELGKDLPELSEMKNFVELVLMWATYLRT